MWKRKVQSLAFKAQHQDTSSIADDRLRMAADRFFDFSRNLKLLDQRIRIHYSDMLRTAKSRSLVLESLRAVSLNSPLQQIVGESAAAAAPASWMTSNDQHDIAENDENHQHGISNDDSTITSSYAAAFDAQQVMTHLQTYQREIVSYAGEWEKTVTTRVSAELKHHMALYRAWEKYHGKVQSLKLTLQRRKQQRNPSLEDKLAWNESKLRNAKREYRRNLIAVTLLTEEVTDRSWKELVPLLLRMIDFDVSTTKDAKEVAMGLLDVREEMVQLSRRYEMEFETLHKGRLRIIREEDAIDFVDPEDLQDLESSIANSFEKELINRVTRNGTPTCSDKDSHSTAEEKPHDEKVADERPIEVAANVVEDDGEDDDSCTGVPNYPKSIYLVPGVGTALADDETTLTGVPDLASC